MAAKGLQSLKRANEEMEYDMDMVLELDKCRKDPIYFMRNYVKIKHPKLGTVPFDLYDYQEEIVKAIHNNRDVLVLTARQMGKCFSRNTKYDIINKPNWFKKLILYFIDRKTYEQIKKL